MNPKNIPGEKSKHKRLYTILVHLYEILGKKTQKNYSDRKRISSYLRLEVREGIAYKEAHGDLLG